MPQCLSAAIGQVLQTVAFQGSPKWLLESALDLVRQGMLAPGTAVA